MRRRKHGWIGSPSTFPTCYMWALHCPGGSPFIDTFRRTRKEAEKLIRPGMPEIAGRFRITWLRAMPAPK